MKATKTMDVTSSKSSMQSDLGAMSRKLKLSAEQVTLGHNRWYHKVRVDDLLPLPPSLLPNNSRCDMMMGSPSIRAVSKIAASIMQIALKVKSDTQVNSLSPTLSLLSGGNSWSCITGSMRVKSSRPGMRHTEPVIATSNLHHMLSLSRVGN